MDREKALRRFCFMNKKTPAGMTGAMRFDNLREV